MELLREHLLPDLRSNGREYVKKASQIMALLVLFEVVVNYLIINYVPYTEIDWVAYMEEVEGVVNGTYDYTMLKGQTGPLVYPAGFVYLYYILYMVTGFGHNILLGQYIFMGLYIMMIVTLLQIYRETKMTPVWTLGLLVLSRRIHSIFVLRLFNDCWAMALLYLAVLLFIKDRWTLGCAVFSLAVSIKMNVLLFAPGLLLLLVKRFGVFQTIPRLLLCGTIQIVLGLPFLFVNPHGYVKMAFDLGRKFIFYWSVNWKFIPEDVFLSNEWGLGLLAVTLICWLGFGMFKWTSSSEPLWTFFTWSSRPLDARLVTTVLFSSNFIGIVFSRSLHFQFYTWYYHTLPLLLWTTQFPTPIKLLLLGAIEVVWNIFPSNPVSSATLFVCHMCILAGLITSERVGPDRPKSD